MGYIRHLDAPQFFSGDVCKATDVDPATFKNWIARDQAAILISDEHRATFKVDGPSHERVATGSGRSHLFTFRRVLQIGVIGELVSLGVTPRRAGMIALKFTDTGEGVSFCGSGRHRTRRLPGMLYPDGLTLLVSYANEETGTVINMMPNDTFMRVVVPGAKSAIVLNVGDVCRQVIKNLGLSDDWMPVQAEE